MPRHPTFYVSLEIVRAVNLQSFRKRDRGMEASRCRGMMRYSVICDPATAAELIPKIEALRDRSAEPSFRASCEASIDAIRRAIDEAAAPMPTPDPDASSHKAQGYLGRRESTPTHYGSEGSLTERANETPHQTSTCGRNWL